MPFCGDLSDGTAGADAVGPCEWQLERIGSVPALRGSRDTFYEWRRRRDSGAEDWFVDSSHGPHHCPQRTVSALVATIVDLQRRFPHMGPRKLLAILRRKASGELVASASTIGGLLKQAGPIAPVRRRLPPLGQQRPFAAVHAPNDERAVDFKGWFQTHDGARVDPLTLTDSFSRHLLDIAITPQTIDAMLLWFLEAFLSLPDRYMHMILDRDRL